jgi:predicted dehydrogenase
MFEVDYITQDLTFYENGQTLGGFHNLQMLRGVSEGRIIREKVEKREPLRAELEDFIGAVRGGRPPRVTGEDGLNVLRVAAAIVRSGQTHQPVEFSA